MGDEEYVVSKDKRQYDGKQMRKAILRRTIDFGSSVMLATDLRRYYRGDRQEWPSIEPEPYELMKLRPPREMFNTATNVSTHLVQNCTNKMRFSVNCVTWTPEGRRLQTGVGSGEFTLWNGLTFNFETILQAHLTSIRAMRWSPDGSWLLSGDDNGVIKYWMSNMNNLSTVIGHDRVAVRDLAFSPSGLKFASCADEPVVKLWDFATGEDDGVLRGHGWDVKSVDWHPQSSLVASGGKDNTVRVWDSRHDRQVASFADHKQTVHVVRWHAAGTLLLSGARDQSLRIYDTRMMRELRSYRTSSQVTCAAWHPIDLDHFVSCGSDGSLAFWNAERANPLAVNPHAHEGPIWGTAWHPLGHMLATGGNDQHTKFWARNRPGERLDSQCDTAAIARPNAFTPTYSTSLNVTRNMNLTAHAEAARAEQAAASTLTTAKSPKPTSVPGLIKRTSEQAELPNPYSSPIKR